MIGVPGLLLSSLQVSTCWSLIFVEDEKWPQLVWAEVFWSTDPVRSSTEVAGPAGGASRNIFYSGACAPRVAFHEKRISSFFWALTPSIGVLSRRAAEGSRPSRSCPASKWIKFHRLRFIAWLVAAAERKKYHQNRGGKQCKYCLSWSRARLFISMSICADTKEMY